MPKEISDATPGMKLLHLYYLMVFTGRCYFLSELADKMDCPKQTVLRLVDQLTLSGLVDLETGKENRRAWYRIRAPRRLPQVSLSAGSGVTPRPLNRRSCPGHRDGQAVLKSPPALAQDFNPGPALSYRSPCRERVDPTWFSPRLYPEPETCLSVF